MLMCDSMPECGMATCLAWPDMPRYMSCCGGWCMGASQKILALPRKKML